MAPLIVLTSTFLLLSLAARIGVVRLRDWVLRLRIALAAMFLLTASAHWGALRPDLVRMVPAVFPNPELWVTLTGIAEIAGAVGLLLRRFASAAALGLLALLVAVFPANVHAAQEGLTLGGTAVLGLLPRSLLQLLFLAATAAAGFGQRWPRKHAMCQHDACG